MNQKDLFRIKHVVIVVVVVVVVVYNWALELSDLK